MDELMYIMSRQASRRDSVDTRVFNQTYSHFNVGFDLKAALDKARIARGHHSPAGRHHHHSGVQRHGADPGLGALPPMPWHSRRGKKLNQYVKAAGGYSQLARRNKGLRALHERYGRHGASCQDRPRMQRSSCR